MMLSLSDISLSFILSMYKNISSTNFHPEHLTANPVILSSAKCCFRLMTNKLLSIRKRSIKMSSAVDPFTMRRRGVAAPRVGGVLDFYIMNNGGRKGRLLPFRVCYRGCRNSSRVLNTCYALTLINNMV